MDKLLIPFILSLLLLCAQQTAAQDCSCVNCSQAIPINSSVDVEFEINGATNGDLSNASQGVCGVILEFSHEFIWSVEMVLTSPSGQQITLIGANVTPPLGSYTGFAYWDIVFLPAASAVSPDVPFNVTWNNNQAWATAGQYNGSYYPNVGSLEDFNTGSVNGTWQLSITNTSTFYGGQIDNFQVILCDDAGLNCEDCLADAGDLSAEPDIMACEGSSSLAFSPNPLYTSGSPDPSTYSYTYVISDATGIIAYQTSPDLTALPSGNYTVYGLSYLTADQARLPAPGSANLNDLNNLLSIAINPFICGALSTDWINVNIQAGNLTDLVETICAGDVYTVDGTDFSTTDIHTITIPTGQACDSTVRLDLTVLDTFRVFIQDSICEGESYPFGGNTYDMPGRYEAVLMAENNCDSTVVLDLIVLDTSLIQIDSTICEGENVLINGTSYETSNQYVITLTGENDCDSTIILDLTVLDTVLVNRMEVLCEGEDITIGGMTYQTTGQYTIPLTGTNTCDSTILLDLVVEDTVLVNRSETICEGNGIEIGGTTYDQTNIYTIVLTGSNNCDSTIILDLTVQDTVLVNRSETICEGNGIEIGGTTYDQTNSYTISLTGSNNCDSTIILDLMVLDTVLVNRSETICEGNDIEIGGTTYDQTNIYTIPLPSNPK
ncbi:MAG: hypothetical protein AAFP19_03265 [Bacteroidota bacterium]